MIQMAQKYDNQKINFLVQIFDNRQSFLNALHLHGMINSMDADICKDKETTGAGLIKNEIYHHFLYTEDKTQSALRKIGARVAKRCISVPVPAQKSILFQLEGDLQFSNIYEGFFQKIYKFSKYITLEKEKLLNVQNIYLLSSEYNTQEKINSHLEESKQIMESIYLLKDLVNETPNILYPESYANIIKDAFKNLECSVKIFDENALASMNANLILAVGQGSTKPSRMVVIEYFGRADSKEVDITLVGKGVTFDSGGLSLKPPEYMETMKCDMAGSACVVSQMLLLAKRKAKVNAVGLVGLVENMPDGNAICVSSVVKSMSGQTVEILNTDAEGRLVLADVLYYASTTYKPKHIINLATLTGAIVVALGEHYAGLFSNDSKLATKLQEIGMTNDDRCWQMPMGAEYFKTMKSQIADMKNISSIRREAGSTTAACFLEKFIADHKSWAHLDIAGVAYHEREVNDSDGSGASGFGIRLLNDFIKSIE